MDQCDGLCMLIEDDVVLTDVDVKALQKASRRVWNTPVLALGPSGDTINVWRGSDTQRVFDAVRSGIDNPMDLFFQQRRFYTKGGSIGKLADPSNHHSTSIIRSLPGRIELAQLNEFLRAKEDEGVKDARTVKKEMYIIMTSVYTYNKDPQRYRYISCDFDYISNFYNSVYFHRLRAVIMHDCFNEQFVERYETDNIRFIRVHGDVTMSTNDFRFMQYNTYVKKNYADYYIFVDASDVFFNGNPFSYMRGHEHGHTLFMSPDIGTFNKNAWQVKRCYKGTGSLWDQSVKMHNAGAWGGDHRTSKCILKCIVKQFETTLKGIYNCNMPALNWCVHFGGCTDENTVEDRPDFVNPFRKECRQSHLIIHNKCKDTEGKVCLVLRDDKLVLQDRKGSRCKPLKNVEEYGKPLWQVDARNTFDVVLVSGSVTCVLELVIKKLKTHLIDVGNIHVITLPHLVEKCNRIDGIHCHDENTILQRIDMKLNMRNKNGWMADRTRISWYYQQFLKLFAYQYITLSERFLIWDADNVLLKLYSPVKGQKTRFVIGGWKGNPYAITSNALTGLLSDRNDIVVHQMLIDREILDAMMVHLCGTVRKESCANIIIDNIPKHANPILGFSEYHLYYTWFISKEPNRVFIDPQIKFLRTDPVNKGRGTQKDCVLVDKKYAENVYMMVLETKSEQVKKNST